MILLQKAILCAGSFKLFGQSIVTQDEAQGELL